MRTADKFIGRKKDQMMRVKAASFARKSTSRRVRPRRIAPTSKFLFDGLPEPIDLELDLTNRFIYWTDRGDPPRGNTVNRASMDADFTSIRLRRFLLTHLMEGIGIALDFKGDRMFLTDLAGTIYSAKLDGSEKKPLLVAQGNLTGIAYAEKLQRSMSRTQRTSSSLRLGVMSYNKPIRRIAIVGTGVIGASWAAEYLARGFDVIATDPAPNAEANLRKYIDEAWKDLTSIGLSEGASRDRLTFTTNMKEALSKADFVQENGPERPDFKTKLFRTWTMPLPSIRSSRRVRPELRQA